MGLPPDPWLAQVRFNEKLERRLDATDARMARLEVRLAWGLGIVCTIGAFLGASGADLLQSVATK